MYQVPHTARHHVPRCSCAYLLWWGVWAVNILVPYFLAYNMNNLWLKESVVVQQPTVRFKHMAMASMESTMPSGEAAYARWSTESAYNKLYGSDMRVADVSSVEVDDNRDGNPEFVEVTIMLPKFLGESVKRASALLFFNYTITDFVDLDVEGLAYIEGGSHVAGSQLWVAGDLRLRQLRPVGFNRLDNVYRGSAVETVRPTVKDALFTTILGEYSLRNITTYVSVPTSVWTPGDAGKSDGSTMFSIVARLRIPEEVVRYRPGFWETMKYFWMQYVAVFLAVRYLTSYFEWFVYANRVLDTTLTLGQQTYRKPNF